MSPAAGVPWRPLVAITVVVACLHALALRGAPGPLRWQAAGATFQVALRDPEPASSTLPVANRRRQTRPPGARVAAGAPRSAASSASAGAASRDGATMLATVLVPQSATWHFAITAQWRGVPVVGDAVLAWRHDGTTYEASLALAAPPLPRREQRSTGELAADGLRAAPVRRAVAQRGGDALRPRARPHRLQQQPARRAAAGRRPGPLSRAAAARRLGRRQPRAVRARRQRGAAGGGHPRGRRVALHRRRR